MPKAKRASQKPYKGENVSTKKLFDYTEIGDMCIKCGKCIQSCTIHHINPDETTSPRGYLDLLRAYHQGNLDLDKEAKAIFESCFLCTSCVDVCPNSLPTDRLIEHVREDIAKRYGIAWYKRLIFWVLEHRKAMDWLMRMGYMVKGCFLSEEKNGLKSRFWMPFIKKGRMLPSMMKRSFLNSHPETIAAPHPKSAKQRVAIFIGCLSNYNYQGVGESLLEILAFLNIEAFIPKDQLCCGAPAYFTGATDSVERMSKKNIEYFESFIKEYDAIIVPEATCSAMMIHDWEHFFADRGMEEWAQRAKNLSLHIKMATQWLYDKTDLYNRLKELNVEGLMSVTYHDPCHAKKVQGIDTEPRKLLEANRELVEMSDSTRCCGFGGVTIQSEKFDLAQKAGAPKAEMIKNANTSYVSAECSACRIQISESLNAINSEVEFKNPLELIAQAIKEAKKATPSREAAQDKELQ